MSQPHIVILGAGYAGLQTARDLQKKVGANDARITVVNQNAYHYETTWLHEASAGTTSFDKTCYDIASLLPKKHIRFVQDTVTHIHHEDKKVLLKNETLTYDYLVVALGFESETFGIAGLKEHAFSISNLNAARKLHHHILAQFAHYHTDNPSPEKEITIVVGGGGFTGMEFLGELVNQIPLLCSAYDVPRNQVRIFCIEASPNLLAGFEPSLAQYAKSYLMKQGVTFRIGAAIKEVTPTGIVIQEKDKEETTFLETNTVIWSAGVRGNHLIESAKLDAQRGRVRVDAYLRYADDTDIFIIGDCSLIINEKENRPYPPTAQISMQQGQNVAKNLVRIIRKKTPLIPFVYKPKGTVCSLGHKNGVGVVFGVKIKGRIAAFMKMVIDNRALYMLGGLRLLFKKGK